MLVSVEGYEWLDTPNYLSRFSPRLAGLEAVGYLAAMTGLEVVGLVAVKGCGLGGSKCSAYLSIKSSRFADRRVCGIRLMRISRRERRPCA